VHACARAHGMWARRCSGCLVESAGTTTIFEVVVGTKDVVAERVELPLTACRNRRQQHQHCRERKACR